MNRALLLSALLISALPAGARMLSVNECVKYANQHAPEIQRLRLSWRNQKLSTRLQKANFAVTLKGSASHDPDAEDTSGSLSLKKAILGGIDIAASASVEDAKDDESDSGTLSLTISKIILGGGSVRESRLGIDNSILSELVALNKLNKERRRVEFTVKRSYYRIIRDLQTLKVRKMKLQRSKTNLEHALEREEPLDIATAQIEVPETQAAVLSAQRSIEASLDALKELMGMPIPSALSVDTNLVFTTEAVNVTNDLKHCLANHEDFLNAALEMQKLENTGAVRKGKRLPQVSVSGTSKQSSAGSMDFDGDPEYSLGLSFSWELGRTTDRVNYLKALNDIESRKIATRALHLAKEKEIRGLGRRLSEALSLIALQKDKVKFSERKNELYANKWENGEIGILEYVRSQNDVENSRIQLINYMTDYMERRDEYNFATAR